MRRHPYYFLAKCIESCLTVEQVEACERMINNISRELADKALQKKVELIATIYSPE
jgi:hypothetical protein